mgnify:CR=1 FL=1
MIWSILIGLFVGLVAKALMPGRDPGGFIITIILGIAGAMLANWIGGNMGIYQQGEPAGFLAAVLGAMFILFLFRMAYPNKKGN